MKVSSSTVQDPVESVPQQILQFRAGIIGFPGFDQAEIIYKAEELPFMWLRGTGKEKLSFLTVEPAGLVPNYEVEITDADLAALELKDPADAMVLLIATLNKGDTVKVSVNLIGPIVINKKTLQARQIVIGNSHKYSARHILFETKEG